MRLIDILNKIANGELKEDYRTKIKMNGLYYKLFAGETADNLLTDLFIHLNDEVELIEPHHIRDDTKMIEPTDNTKIEELDKEEMLCLTLQCAIAVLTDKLNDVIRYINKED